LIRSRERKAPLTPAFCIGSELPRGVETGSRTFPHSSWFVRNTCLVSVLDLEQNCIAARHPKAPPGRPSLTRGDQQF
jgi:hypothetical protein